MLTGGSRSFGVPAPDTINRYGIGDVKRFSNADGTWRDCVYAYNDTGAVTVANQVVLIGHGVTPASGYLAKTPVAVTGSVQIGVAETAIAFGGAGWFAFAGYCTPLTITVLQGEFVRLTVGTSTIGLTRDGTLRGLYSVGKAQAAQASATPTASAVQLFGDLVSVS